MENSEIQTTSEVCFGILEQMVTICAIWSDWKINPVDFFYFFFVKIAESPAQTAL